MTPVALSRAAAPAAGRSDTADAITVLFPGAPRKRRLAESAEASFPREFFYGALALADGGAAVRYGDTHRDPDGRLARAHLLFERVRNRIGNFGLSRQRVSAIRNEIDGARLAISFTDGFSLSLGYYRDLVDPGAFVVGGFHGLADTPDEVAPPFRFWARAVIRKGLARLDHLFFFGEADRQEAIRRFGIPAAKTSLFRFGVDTEFWCPGDEATTDRVLSVGSDPKRDYATLLAAPIPGALQIITRLKLKIPEARPDVEIIHGSYHNMAVTDAVLRDLYRRAAIVAVPLRDVFQPTGYSVTLQAMACGKPVVLSHIKGLWDPDAFVSGENCLLVEPENPRALADAVARLRADPALRRRIGAAARETALHAFPLQRMNDSLAKMVARCGAGQGTASKM